MKALEQYEHVKGYEHAWLPVRYEAAKKKLAECVRLDECVKLKDQSEALRSYARQAHDDDLYRMALKIQNRARIRMGELLRMIESQKGGDRKSKGHRRPLGRVHAATAAGISERQAKEAKAMSRVPKKKREEMVERGATATEIAKEGKKYDDAGATRSPQTFRCVHCGKKVTSRHNCLPRGFEEATKLMGDLGRLSEFLSQNNPKVLAMACREQERIDLKKTAERCTNWLNRLVKELTRKQLQRRKKK